MAEKGTLGTATTITRTLPPIRSARLVIRIILGSVREKLVHNSKEAKWVIKCVIAQGQELGNNLCKVKCLH